MYALSIPRSVPPALSGSLLCRTTAFPFSAATTVGVYPSETESPIISTLGSFRVASGSIPEAL
jgi:hypothetical protein